MKRISEWSSGLVVLGIVCVLPGVGMAQIGDIPDSEIERCLEEGKIGKKAGKIHGVTRPVRLSIECSVDVDSAVFKSVDEHRQGLPAKVGGIPEMHFSDCYKYERAAYLLDRELGLNLAPVSVIRKVKRIEGALVSWIPNTTFESHMTKLPTGPQVAELAQRKALMRLFDALILNVDRREENWLIDKETWKLFMIDHSRAFRVRTKLPEEYTSKRSRVTRALYEKLEALDEARLTELMGHLISHQQIRSLLIRRDLILEKVDRDCEEWGCEAVFTDWQGTPPIARISSAVVDPV